MSYFEQAKNKKDRPNIVTIGGGSGQFALLSGLRDVDHINVSAIVSMVDSGGSTGRLRDELGTLPPGDILKCILALSPHKQTARKIFQKRFKKDRRLQGHNAGNMLLTMLSRYTGSFPAGVQALAEILDAKGTILPVTIDRATLVAELTDGTRIYGESAIDVPKGTQREKINDVFLVPHHSDKIKVYQPVLNTIQKADIIVVGPGDLFTSIIPNLIVPGLSDQLEKTKAKLVYVVNIMTKFGETHHYGAMEFVNTLESFTHREFDAVIMNAKKPSSGLIAGYQKEKSELVHFNGDASFWGSRKIYREDLIESSENIIRHDPAKLAGLILKILSESGSPVNS